MPNVSGDLSERYFPSFASCPGENSLDTNFYTIHDTSSFVVPSHHWCLLAEIVDTEFFIRLQLNVRDRDGQVFRVMFYLEDDDQDTRAPANAADFRPGHTVAVMYAQRHHFLDFSTGIRQETMRTIKVIPTDLNTLLRLGAKVFSRVPAAAPQEQQQQQQQQQQQCDSCGATKPGLRVCAKCTLASYCDRDCQRRGWIDLGHRKECKVWGGAKEFFAVEWDKFEGFRSV